MNYLELKERTGQPPHSPKSQLSGDPAPFGRFHLPMARSWHGTNPLRGTAPNWGLAFRRRSSTTCPRLTAGLKLAPTPFLLPFCMRTLLDPHITNGCRQHQRCQPTHDSCPCPQQGSTASGSSRQQGCGSHHPNRGGASSTHLPLETAFCWLSCRRLLTEPSLLMDLGSNTVFGFPNAVLAMCFVCTWPRCWKKLCLLERADAENAKSF